MHYIRFCRSMPFVGVYLFVTPGSDQPKCYKEPEICFKPFKYNVSCREIRGVGGQEWSHLEKLCNQPHISILEANFSSIFI